MKPTLRWVLVVPFVLSLGSCATVDRWTGAHYQEMTKRLFKPSGRIFLDTGNDDANEVDIFQDGSLAASISLIELYYPWADVPLDPAVAPADRKAVWDWRFGPTVGFGITGAAEDSPNGMTSAGGAPVALFTAGFLLELPVIKDSKSIVGLEFGYAIGFSADESLDDANDSAIYVGFTVDIPWS